MQLFLLLFFLLLVLHVSAFKILRPGNIYHVKLSSSKSEMGYFNLGDEPDNIETQEAVVTEDSRVIRQLYYAFDYLQIEEVDQMFNKIVEPPINKVRENILTNLISLTKTAEEIEVEAENRYIQGYKGSSDDLEVGCFLLVSFSLLTHLLVLLN